MSLRVSDARERARLLAVRGYELELDLDRGARLFGSRVRIAFSCREPGASTFLDVRARELRSATLNGRRLDPTTCVDGRLSLPDLEPENVVEVDAVMAFRRDGEGLHRASDPADGADYVYGMTFLDAAPTVFACFDQPDLKAPYEVGVRAPLGWRVIGNGAARETEPGRWRLARTQPLATYVVTICAGPWERVGATHRGIELGWYARASLAPQLREQAPELLAVTASGLDHFEELFGIAYPFGPGYDQVLVPEFNAGAMENPACVTFAETALHRGAATTAQRRGRATTILHEMAHMWFGDLVTMRWWDDLWLNESFAEYLAHRALEATGVFEGAWVDFGIARKAWGYAAERRPSTHPVAANPAPDAAAALANFDGISYAKGASVLRQLIAHVGDEAFVAGVRAHLSRHAHGNADLADFLAALGSAAGRDLAPWAQAWLRTAGRDELGVRLECAGGRITGADLLRTPPAAHPPDHPADRPHTLDVAGFRDGRQLWREPVRTTRDRAPLPQLVGADAPALVLPNASDLTWADVRLDGASAAALPHELARVADPTARVVAWVALIDAVTQGREAPALFFDTLVAALPSERDSGVVAMLGRVGTTLAGSYLPDPREGWAALTAAGIGLLDATKTAAAPDDSLRLAALRVAADASDDADLLASWLRGEGPAAALAGDRDFGWLCVTGLARLGAIDADGIDAHLAQDTSLQGRLQALTARAAIPTVPAKAAAWRLLAGPGEAGNHERLHTAHGFWRLPADPPDAAPDDPPDAPPHPRPDSATGPHLDLRPYVARYCEDLPRL
ncbi:aminopeptidase N, partial [Piscicoccus intestinalis]|uniref:aminopeptidase N n=1 Tax=Piscicoccus intestinalis TaxID=746033 RepID=UPI000A6A86DC